MDRRIGVMHVEGGTRKDVVCPHRVRVDQARANVDRGRERLDRVQGQGDGHQLRQYARRRRNRITERLHIKCNTHVSQWHV